MSNLIAREPENKEFELVPEGAYIARCYRIVGLGTQPYSFAGGEVKPRYEVAVAWELLDDDVKMADGRPFTTTKTYRLSLDKKAALRADLEAWRGKAFTLAELEGFDLEKVLGTYCRVQIVHTESAGGDRVYANINSIMAMKPSEPKPKPVNSDVFFDIQAPDRTVFDGLSDYLKKKIEAAPEWHVASTM